MFTKYLLIQTSSGVILSADLQTLESYSRRIRHIHISTFKEKVSSHIYNSITRHLSNNNSRLFPALRCFTIDEFDGISEGNFAILPLIASSSLSMIGIHDVTDAIEIHLASFFHAIADSRPSSPAIHPLSSLFLDGVIKMSTLAQLDNFKKLSTLEITFEMDFPLGIFSSLSRLPSLSALSLELYSVSIPDLESFAKPAVYSFSNLQRLSLVGNGNLVLRALQSIYGERLLRVVLGLESYSTTDSLQACVKRCPEMAPHMLCYSIFVHSSQNPHRYLFPPLPDNYAQLQTFAITSTAIPLEHFRDLFDHVRMGLWSALETLIIHFRDPEEPLKNWRTIQQVVPLSSLSMLAASCPRLQSLDLYLYYPFDEGDRETKVLEDHIQNSQSESNHKLANLEIVFLDPFVTVPRPGGVMDAVTVSLFIDHLFPNLQSFDISDRVGDVRRDWYSGIKAMVKNNRNVRERNAVKGAPIISN